MIMSSSTQDMIKDYTHYTRIASIFVFPIVSDWTNVFIVTWLSYAEEEITYSLALAPDWLTNVSRQAVRLYLLSYSDKELTNSVALAFD